MASNPKKRRMLAVLTQMTRAELGEHADPLDFVVQWIASGQTVTSLAAEISRAMGEPASRNWISSSINRLPTTPGKATAKERIARARRQAAFGRKKTVSSPI